MESCNAMTESLISNRTFVEGTKMRLATNSNQQYIGFCARIPIHEKTVRRSLKQRITISELKGKYDPDTIVDPPPVTPWSLGEFRGGDDDDDADDDFRQGGDIAVSPLFSHNVTDEAETVKDITSRIESRRKSDDRKQDRTWPFLKSRAAKNVFRPRRFKEDSNPPNSARKAANSGNLTHVLTTHSAGKGENSHDYARHRTSGPLDVQTQRITDGNNPTEESEQDSSYSYQPPTDYRVSWKSWHMRECISAPPPTACSNRDANKYTSHTDSRPPTRKLNKHIPSSPDGISPRSQSQCTSPRIPEVIQRQLVSFKRPPSHLVTASRRFPSEAFEKCTWGDVMRIKSCKLARETEEGTISGRLWNGEKKTPVEKIPLSEELRDILNADRHTLKVAFTDSKQFL